MTKRESVLLRVLRRALIIILITVLMTALFLYAVMYELCKGPSPTAKELFVRSVKETSAIGFLPGLFLSAEEIDGIMSRAETAVESTDASLVTVAKPAAPEDTPQADAWGFVDEDGDGLILVPVAGESFFGDMLIVLDPSRVIMGCKPKYFHQRGFTLEEMVTDFDAAAGINGGGFEDPNGTGDGSVPDRTIVFEGEVFLGGKGTGSGFVGIDDQYVLHVGLGSVAELEEKKIQYGTSYGPILVVNGEVPDPASLRSGLNPRTAIGQRSDGAILMLVIAGRQPNSLGATYADEAAIMLKFGAVNACNLDGGSSSLMWIDGGYRSNSSTVVGIRRIPTCFLVLKEGADAHE